MRRKSSLAGAGIGAMILTLAASIALPLASSSVASAATAHVSVAPSAGPAFIPPDCGTGTPAYNYEGSGDAADPQVVYSAGTYYAFTTGNALGNNIAALVSSSPNSGYGPYTGKCYGSTALPSPSVVGAGEHADLAGRLHLRRALGDVLRRGPVGPRVGHRLRLPGRGHRGVHLPHRCAVQRRVQRSHRMPGNGIHRPPALRRPSTGVAYLVWKQNDGGSSAPAYIWSQQLNAAGTGFAPGSTPTMLLTNNTVSYPWEATVEDPSMVAAGGGYYLAFSAGVYTSTGYSEGITTCSGPLGPCGAQSQILTTYGSVLGPGGGALFADASGNWWLDYAGVAGRLGRVHELHLWRSAAALCRTDLVTQRHRPGSL